MSSLFTEFEPAKCMILSAALVTSHLDSDLRSRRSKLRGEEQLLSAQLLFIVHRIDVIQCTVET